MVSFHRVLSLLGFAVLGIVLSGCPKRTEEVAPEEETAEAPAEEQAPAEETPASAPALEIGTDYAAVPALAPIRFDYMRADLTPDTRAVLKRNAAVVKAVLQAAKTVQVRVEGHCDERGTLEYNLALGQRRANALRDYYLSFGIPKGSLKTVSYGEERPVCAEATEDCWAQNRRGETTLRSSEPVRIPLSDLPQE